MKRHSRLASMEWFFIQQPMEISKLHEVTFFPRQWLQLYRPMQLGDVKSEVPLHRTT
ncbi:hypothetical protein TIFTF001_051288 [Ficus carica]|uniref:Uncharacterized protein n=1 Tax=Ficus carica TaxID=3494 RepID=A0AA87YVN1_FICCA|nr:hypothetical protein TIFTF001_051288 [Ficus carica]